MADKQAPSLDLLSPSSKFGGSLTELNEGIPNEGQNNEFKEKPGLLRRAFSSKHRRKPKGKLEMECSQGRRLGSNLLPAVFPLRSSLSQGIVKSRDGSSETLILEAQ